MRSKKAYNYNNNSSNSIHENNTISIISNANRHFPNLLECTRNNSLKSRRGMKPIEKKCFLCPQNKFGKCL